MLSNPESVREAQRIEALLRYDVLDTPAEPALDGLTQLAAQICGVPMSLISLVDEQRQWYKARVGIEVTETSRSVSFCVHALQEPGVLVVPDALEDQRFQNNPLVLDEPRIRFYAGAPLITPQGESLGTLCVMDRVPRNLEPEQLEALEILSGLVMTHLELKRQAVELQQAQVRSSAVVEYALEAIVTMDHQGRVTEFNPAAEKMFGHSRAEALGREVAELIIPEAYRERHREGIARYLCSGESVVLERRLEMRALHSDGTEFPIELTVTRWGEVSPPVFVGFIRDLTEREAAQGKLRRYQERLSRLVDSNVQGVAFWRRDGKIVEANEAFLDLLGYSRDELKAGLISGYAITPPEYAELDQEAFRDLDERGVCAPFEKEFLRKDGSRVPVLVGAAAFEEDTDEGVCFVVDLTERKKLEQQFLEAQRLENLGSLARGIAHELNNALGPILISAELLKSTCTEEGQRVALDTMRSNTERAAQMVQQIMSFAGGLEGQQSQVSFGEIVRNVERIVRDTFPKQIEVEFLIPSALPPARGETTQLHQLLLNLCIRAQECMPRGGKLSLVVEKAVLDEQYVSQTPEARVGIYLQIELKYSGEDCFQKLGENAQAVLGVDGDLDARGGFGLLPARDIVTLHGGFLRLSKDPSIGTVLQLYLPTLNEVLEEGQASMPRGNGELILVVDDELSIRQTTGQTLEAFGYRVLTASDGAEALAEFTIRGPEITAVLTNMMMPLVDGSVTVQVLRKMAPDLPIIVMSGLNSSVQQSRAFRLGAGDFLSKPYSAAALLECIHKAVQSRATGA